MATDIESILKTTIQVKIIEAFNEAPDVIEKLVKAALSKNVDSSGNPPRYGGGEPFLDYLVGNEIRQAVKVAVATYVADHKATIDQKVADALATGDYGTAIGKAISAIMAEEWRWNFVIHTHKKSE